MMPGVSHTPLQAAPAREAHEKPLFGQVSQVVHHFLVAFGNSWQHYAADYHLFGIAVVRECVAYEVVERLEIVVAEALEIFGNTVSCGGFSERLSYSFIR